jgi:cell division protein FtsW
VESRIDRGLILLTSLLLLYGLVMVYSASAPFALRHFNTSSHLFLKQLIAAAIGAGLLVFLAYFDYHRLERIHDVAFLGSFLLTCVTLFPLTGITEGRWLHVGPFALQPTEFLKLALILYLAVTIVRKGPRIKSFTEGVLPFAVIFLVLSGVIMNQPDFGMVLMLGILILSMLFLGGARLWHLGSLGIGIIPFALLAIYAAPYRMARLLAFFNPQAHRTSSGYQVIQSLIAIGSGGILGRGLGASRTKLFYLPQSHNDFIFSVTAEELGMVGSFLLIGLFGALAWRSFEIARYAPDRLGALLALGIGFAITVQALVNFGVAMGVLPVTGLTLPFISNGGSSLIVTLSMIGVLLNISKQGGHRCGS